MDITQFTPATWVGVALALVLALGIIVIGVSYLVAPEASSRGFGFRSAITPEVIPWQHIKGPRDIVGGLVPIAVLLFFGPAPAATAILVETLIPIGDALTIIRHRGRMPAAIGIHLTTAVAMVVAALLLLA